MSSFLEEVVDDLIDRNVDFKDHICIVPSKRIALFVKKHLHNKYQNTFFVPQFYTISDLVSETSPLKKLDSLTLQLRFFETYNKVSEEKTEFSEFLSWSQQALNDFNEIDLYQVDSKDLFNYISDARAIEVWNVDGSEITPFQQNYLRFWKSLGKLYNQFKSDLLDRGEAYSGMILNDVLSNSKVLTDRFKSKSFSIIGLNALSPSEIQLFKQLKSVFPVKFYWDSDQYYIENNDVETGYFIRKNQKLFDSWKNEFDSRNEEKQLNISASAQNIFQAKSIASILDESNEVNLTNSAILLSDESTLIPLLNSINTEKLSPNVSMGFSIKNTSIYSLIEVLLDLKIRQRKHQGNSIYFKDLVRLIDHELVAAIIGQDELKHIKEQLVKRNLVYISTNKLEELISKSSDTIKLILSEINNKELIPWLVDVLRSIKKDLNFKKASWESEQIFVVYQRLMSYKDLFKEYSFLNELKTFKLLFRQLLSRESIDLVGEPLKGIQVMGLLESRGLDFETVFITNVNEGILPKQDKSNSLIPYDIKVLFGMPTWRERDAIYAYYFYRAIQRAKNVYLFYSDSTDDTGGGEKSRFISQIEYEWNLSHPKVSVEYVSNVGKMNKTNDLEISIPSEKAIPNILSFLENKVSPTAMNKYFDCKLDFYYRYILRLGEIEEVEESLSHSSFGSVVHETLEELFTPYIGKEIDEDAIAKMNVLMEPTLKKVLLEKIKEEELYSGKNFLAFKAAKQGLKRFFEQQKEEIVKSSKSLQLQSLEKTFEHVLEVNGVKVRLYGNADRIDDFGGVRIIDYKSGKVELDDIKSKDGNWDNKPKALQLMFYAYLYYKNTGIIPASVGNISFRNMKSWYLPLQINGDTTVTESDLKDFEDFLIGVFSEMIQGEVLFAHNEKAKYCQFC